jgi:hypothetical protein
MMLDGTTTMFPPFVDGVQHLFGPGFTQPHLGFAPLDWNYMGQYGGGGPTGDGSGFAGFGGGGTMYHGGPG